MSSNTHAGLPVAGYQPQADDKVAIVNANKVLEERCIRAAEAIQKTPGMDGRMAALAITNLQQAFMWLNRAVFQPGRVALPDDVPAVAAETAPDAASQDLRSRGEPRIPRREEGLPNGRPHP